MKICSVCGGEHGRGQCPTREELGRGHVVTALPLDGGLTPEEEALRPKTRADCIDAPRPCPWVACKWHLFSEVTEAGSLRLVVPEEIGPETTRPTCTLDVVDQGPKTLDEVGSMFNLTRERARQIEAKALVKLRKNANRLGVDLRTLLES